MNNVAEFTQPTIILGVDPGLNHTGWGIIGLEGNHLKHIASGVLHIAQGELVDRLGEILSQLEQIISLYHPNLASIEKVFVNVNPQSTLRLGQARGAAICAISRFHLPLLEFSPNEIKKAVTGAGRADKTQVCAMVMHLLNLSQTPQSDESDALACALCAYQSYKMETLTSAGSACKHYASPRRGATTQRARGAWTTFALKGEKNK